MPFCDRCGAPTDAPTNFCPRCGRQFACVPAPHQTAYRVARHLRNLAVIWLVWSALRLVPALAWNSFNGMHFPFGEEVAFFDYPFRHFIGRASLFMGFLGLLAGWGLHERRSWARVAAIILAFLNLLNPPLGTIIAVYTLWVLLPRESEVEYQQMAQI
jgi:hypothetical protein